MADLVAFKSITEHFLTYTSHNLTTVFIFNLCTSFTFWEHQDEAIADAKLTQSVEEYDINMHVANDIAKVNSILYSNVLCLSNNQKTVEQQFSK